jgi:hypothetical protein
VDVTVLHIEDCPNTSELLRRLGIVLRHRVPVATRAVSSVLEATELGMHGSPTLLIEGRDPFAGTPDPSLACRLYRTEEGLRGLPSVAQLRAVLTDG